MKSKGLMGIGTLIIFIAVILVAAVAAGVLITTSGSLQQRSLTTGKQTEEGVATGVEVIDVWGLNATDQTVEYIEMKVRLNPGSDPIKMNYSVVTFDTKEDFQQITYAGSDTTAGTQAFNVTYLQQGTNYVQDYLSDGDVITIAFNLSLTGFDTDGVAENERVRIHFIPRTGQPTQVEFVSPEVMNSRRVRLYP
ncbi:archaellin/type IV pilin N-terminal domain-containing protein [Candidatus Altiarchaeota archaeon]